MRTGPVLKHWITREYQHTNRRDNNITRRRRFTSWPLSVECNSMKKSKRKAFRPLTILQPYQRTRLSDRRAASVKRTIDNQIAHECRTQSLSAVRWSTSVRPLARAAVLHFSDSARTIKLKREHILRDCAESRTRLGLHAGREVGPGAPVPRNERALE
jgi:hypothetical protein